MKLSDYVEEIDTELNKLYIKYSDYGLAFSILQFAVNMRNTDEQSKNISKTNNIETCSE